MLGDNTARNDKFHRLIIDWVTLVHIQPHPLVLKAATATKTDCKLEGSWDTVSTLKSLQTHLQRMHRQRCLKIDTPIDVFWMVILSLLASTETMCGHHFWHTSYRIPPLQSCVITECLHSFVSMLGSPITYVVS